MLHFQVHLKKVLSLLPDWVFRVGWGTPLARDFLQLRMEAAQLGTTRAEAAQARTELNLAISNLDHEPKREKLRWAIKTSVPEGKLGDAWGDLYFAEEIAASLRKLGHIARVDRRDQVINSDSAQDDVVLVIRGVEKIRPQVGAINLLWIISHPSRISRFELKSFDRVFAASKPWATKNSKKFGVEITPLLQATNPDKFNPEISEPDSGKDILFVGNTRNQFRTIIKDCIQAGVRPAIYGRDWNRFVPADLICGEFIPNTEIAAMYRSAGIVLNDHWADMATHGFLSNRLFDAVASGARVISDEAVGIEEVFDGAVKTYRKPDELAELCSQASREEWGSQNEITGRARRIGIEHSFDRRAESLIQAALNQL